MIILRKWLDDIILIRGQEISYLETFPSLVELGVGTTIEGVSQILWTPYGYQIEIHTLGPEVMKELKEALDKEKLILEDIISFTRHSETGKFKAWNLREEHLSGRFGIRVHLKGWDQIPGLLKVLR